MMNSVRIAGPVLSSVIRHCSGQLPIQYLPLAIVSVSTANQILRKHNPNKDVSLCNCGVTALLKTMYGLGNKYCDQGTADTMYKSARANDIPGLKLESISAADIADSIDKGHPVLVFGTWYGEKKRCGHVNVIVGYEQPIGTHPDFKNFVCYDAGGTGGNCKRCLIMNNYCWKSTDWASCKFFSIVNEY